MKQFMSFKYFLLIIIIGLYYNMNSLHVEATQLPLIDTVLQFSENSLLDGMDSGWTAVIGDLSYDTGDYVTSPSSLMGTPSVGGTEVLRIEKTFTSPIDLLDCNLGFWVKTSGNIPSDLTVHIETYDTSNELRRWVFYKRGLKLEGSDEIWSHHFISSVAYYYSTSIDMTDINKIRFKFYSTTDDWTFSIDDLRVYPNQDLFPNGAVMLTFDGPYDGVCDWAEPKLDEYSYQGVVATARGNNPDTDDLTRLYSKGWDICVYARLFDYSNPPQQLPEPTFTENTLGELAWLNSLGITRGAANIQCNRHIIDVRSQDILDDDFYFIKGSAWTSTNHIALPFMSFYGGTVSFETDMARLERTAENKNLYIWFNHLDQGTWPTAYTQEQFNTLVDRINELGLEVVTYSQLCERYIDYLTAPTISNPNPINGAVDVPITTTSLSFTLNDPDGDPMDYSVTTTPDIGTGTGTDVNNGLHSITVSGLSPSTTYSWEITVDDGETTPIVETYSFTSEGTIPDLTLLLSAPNGGESWAQGSVQSVTWTSTGSIGDYVKLELLKGGVLDSMISSSTDNDGAFNWAIPVSQAPDSDYRVRVSSIDYPTVTDSSDTDFTIIARAQHLVNGGFEEGTMNGWTKLSGTESWWSEQPHYDYAYEGNYRVYINPSAHESALLSQDVAISTADLELSWAVRRHQSTEYPRLVYVTAYDDNDQVLVDSTGKDVELLYSLNGDYTRNGYKLWFDLTPTPNELLQTSDGYDVFTRNFKEDYTLAGGDANDWASASYIRLSAGVGSGGGGTCFDAFSLTTSILNTPPIADADGPYSTFEGTQVLFDGSSSYDLETPIKYRWDFESDGVWDTLWSTEPTAEYTWNDDYSSTVTLEVTDEEYISTDTSEITVSNVPPSVDTGPDQLTNEGSTVDFLGSFTDPSPLDTHDLQWDLGNGDLSDQLASSTSYMDNGVYTVTLTVTDDDGGTGTDSLTVTVNDLGPSAEFSWSPEPQVEGSPIQFTDLSTSYPDDIISWSWDFGNGDTSNEQNPEYTYTANGIYLVSLTVTDDDGSTSTITHSITITGVTSSLFSDGFESGDFGSWSGVSSSSGETAAVSTSPTHHGTYSAEFTSDGSSTAESSYMYHTMGPQSELYVREYVYVSDNGLADVGDRFWTTSLYSGRAFLSLAGWYETSDGPRWFLVSRSGTSTAVDFSTAEPVPGEWYCVEMHWVEDSDGLCELYVDGVLVCSLSGVDTSVYGGATLVRAGLPYLGRCGATEVVVDCVEVSNSYIGPETGLGSLTVTSPNGGESWAQGSSQSVTWTSTGTTGDNVKIELLKDGLMDTVFSSSTDNDGVYEWVVPVSQDPGYDYRVRIASVDYPTIIDSSDGDFTIANPASSLFSDGFESGDFGSWSGVSSSSGETAAVSTSPTHHGTYSAEFTSDGSSTAESSYMYHTMGPQSELYVREYVYVSDNGLADVGDRFWTTSLYSGRAFLSLAGWYETSDGPRWFLVSRSGTSTAVDFSTAEPVPGEWYCVEMHWVEDSDGLCELYVDGVLVCSLSGVDTSVYGGATLVRAGLPYLGRCGATEVVVDCVEVSNSYIGPETGSDIEPSVQIPTFSAGSGDYLLDGRHLEPAWDFGNSPWVWLIEPPNEVVLKMHYATSTTPREDNFCVGLDCYAGIEYGTQFSIKFDLNNDGVMDADSDDLSILWHGDSHGGSGGDGWTRINFKGYVYEMVDGATQGPQFPEPSVVTAFTTNPSPRTYVEVWIPRSWLPDESYRAHFRYSPNTNINYIWENPNVDVNPSYPWQDVSQYGQIIFED